MPNVKGKKFPYTPEGEAAAEEYAAKTGSPFMMKAKKYGNSPMRKNFGSSLAVNKVLDKDNMQGGLTGKPSGKTGKLGHGPILKKKGGGAALKFREDVNKLDKKIQTGAAKVGSKFKKSVGNLAKSLKVKSTGNIGDKVARKYGTGDYKSGGSKAHLSMNPGESKYKYNVRMKKEQRARDKKASKSTGTGFKTFGYDTWKTPETPKSTAYTKPKSTIKVDPFVGNPAKKATTKNTYGVLRSQKNKKTKAYKPWSLSNILKKQGNTL